MTWLVAGGGVIVALAAYFLGRHQAGRAKVYQVLANLRGRLTENLSPVLRSTPVDVELSKRFERESLIHVEAFLDDQSLEEMRAEALSVADRAERTFIPLHKKGGTISYERIHYCAPRCLAFYHSKLVQNWVSAVVGEQIGPTADHDQSSLSLLVYSQAGDHINWHYDHNFYKGRHFTVLLSLVNRGRQGGASSSQFCRRTPQGDEVVSTVENNLVVFEGARCLHRATAASDGDLRIQLSMTFGTTPKIGLFKEFIRRIKDTAFYGLRVLWD